MPTTTAPNRAAGFTLVELLVVLTIMSLLSAVAMSYMPRHPSALGRHQLVMALDAALDAAKTQAARGGQPTPVMLATLDTSAGQGGSAALSVDPAFGTATDRVIVYADGSSTGGLLRRAGKPFATLDWLTTSLADAR